MENKWATLKTIAAVFKVTAYVLAAIAIIAALVLLIKGTTASAFFVFLIKSAIGVFCIYAISELIPLFLSIEDNTKRAADSLEYKKE